jgi:hypothetical protein
MTTGADLAADGRLATTIIVGLFVAAACTSAATPAPVVTPTASPSITVTPTTTIRQRPPAGRTSASQAIRSTKLPDVG